MKFERCRRPYETTRGVSVPVTFPIKHSEHFVFGTPAAINVVPSRVTFVVLLSEIEAGDSTTRVLRAKPFLSEIDHQWPRRYITIYSRVLDVNEDTLVFDGNVQSSIHHSGLIIFESYFTHCNCSTRVSKLRCSRRQLRN